MAMERARTRGRTRRSTLARGRSRRTAMNRGGLDTSVVPRVVVGVVNGLEIVVVGAVRITRDVLVRTISGVADISAVAATAAAGGVRGVVSATSRMVGDVAGTARGDLTDTVSSVVRRRGGARATLGESSTETATTAASASEATRRPRGRARGPRKRNLAA